MTKTKDIILNLIWRFLERTSAQIVTLIVSIVLARILIPEDYGTVTIATVIISVLNVFIDNGLGNALIQKKECTEVDYCTVFWFNLSFCTFLYLMLFLASPLLERIFEVNGLTSLLRVMGFAIIISSIKSVQQAYVSRKLLFKKFFFSTIIGTVISAIVGILMAISGYGVWSLAAQYLCNVCVDTMVLWFTVEWRPRWLYSWDSFRTLFNFGYRLFCSALLNTVYDNFRQIVVGKIYNPTDLAFYNKGKQFPQMVVVNINSSLDSVLFPVMSQRQDDTNALRQMIQKSITTSAFLLFPMLLGLVGIAEHLVPLLLTEKWNNSIVFLQIFGIIYTLYPMQTTNLNAIKSIGKSNLYLDLEIVQIIVGIVLLVPVISKGPLYIALAYLVASVFNSILIGTVSGKLVGYRAIYQWRSILPYYAMSITMSFVVLMLGRITSNHWIIVLQILTGCILYVIMTLLFKPCAYQNLVEFMKRKNSND